MPGFFSVFQVSEVLYRLIDFVSQKLLSEAKKIMVAGVEPKFLLNKEKTHARISVPQHFSSAALC